MKKYKRNIVKVLVGLVAVALLIKTYTLMAAEEIHVEDQARLVLDVPQKDIITSGQETIIKTFDEIIGIQWLNDHDLFIEGHIEGVLGQYTFDTHKQVLDVYRDGLTSDLPYDETFVSLLRDGSSLFVDQGRLLIKSSTDVFTIIEDMTYEDSPLFQLSEDKSRILFYNTSKNSLVTYYFEEDFYRTVYKDVESPLLKDFYKLVKLSPLGGYVAIEDRQSDSDDHRFSLYGGHSGKVYAKDVKGVDLAWSGDDKYLTYYYSEESQSMDVDKTNFKSRRMAYYDIGKKEIMFIDSTSTDFDMLSKMHWNNSQVSALIGTGEETIAINGLLTYDFSTQSFKEIPLVLDPVSRDTNFDFLESDNMLYIFMESPLDHKIVRLNMTTHEQDILEGLKAFDLEQEKSVFYYHNDHTLLTYDEEKMTLSYGLKEGYAYLDQDVFTVYPKPSLHGIAVLIPQKNVIKLLNID